MQNDFFEHLYWNIIEAISAEILNDNRDDVIEELVNAIALLRNKIPI